MTEIRRILGIDHGEKRIGVAISDPFGMFSRPHSIIQHTDAAAAHQAIRALAESEGVVKIVVGLPSDSQGGVGHQGQIVLAWARGLAECVAQPVVFWDESYSSSAAADILARGGKRRRGEPLDDVAAAAILQEYLDAGGADREPGTPLADFTEHD